MSPSPAAPQAHVISYLVLKAERDPFSGTKRHFARHKSRRVLEEGQLHEGSERPFVLHWTRVWRDKSVLRLAQSLSRDVEFFACVQMMEQEC